MVKNLVIHVNYRGGEFMGNNNSPLELDIYVPTKRVAFEYQVTLL